MPFLELVIVDARAIEARHQACVLSPRVIVDREIMLPV